MQRILFPLAAVLLSACQPPAAEVGRAIFEDNCVTCHGSGGKGDGPAAASLPRKPANLTTIAARNGGAFPWDKVMSQIDGYTRTGPHQVMPQFGEGYDGEMVLFDAGDGIPTPTPKPLVELASYLESIQEP
jgi:mono/diheme cytochrome c family protein